MNQTKRCLTITLFIVGLALIGLAAHQFWFRPTSHLLSLRVLDVGQGDSLYIRLPTGEDIVIDTGPDNQSLAQLGRYLPFGDHEIELLIITHNHADHIGGGVSLLQQYKVDQIWLAGAMYNSQTYSQMMAAIDQRHIPVTIVAAGKAANFGEVQLTVLHPLTGNEGHLLADAHLATVVTKLSYKQFCVWLTGDLDTKHELLALDVAKQLSIPIECPVLKVTHHGSGQATSVEFLAAVKPKVAIISVGAKNRYGHPAAMTLQRLHDIGAQIFRTDQNGTLTVTSNGANFWTKTAK